MCTGVVNALSDIGANDQKTDLSTGAAAIFVRLLAGGLGDRVGHRRVSGIACLGFAITDSRRQ